MCGRYTLTYTDLDEVARMVGASVDPVVSQAYLPRFNIAPASACIVAMPSHRRAEQTPQPVVVPAIWGLPRNGHLVFNVRAETADRRFPGAVAERRCIVPADGFYEWTGARDERRPLWFHRADGKLLLMAGVFEERDDAPPSFAVLTTAAYPPVSAIHLRMPLLLGDDRASDWLARRPRAPLVAENIPLVSRPVSRRVNSAENDDPSCLEPDVGPPQLSFF